MSEKTEESQVQVEPARAAAAGADGAREPWGWTRRQRVGLGMLVGLLVVFLAVQYWRRPYRLNDGPVAVEGQAVVLPQRVDPNVATVQELSRIPRIGETTAGKIVAYREARKETAAGGVVFRQAADLDAVPGIGPKLVEQLGPFLRFPEEGIETQP
jgi:hypothetical protein